MIQGVFNECLFLLLDYKEGTEFLPYQSLPHAHVLSTESDPVFGLRTLEYINNEITRRGVLFKKAGVSNISKYSKLWFNSFLNKAFCIP